jgi:hypothetical protein
LKLRNRLEHASARSKGSFPASKFKLLREFDGLTLSLGQLIDLISGIGLGTAEGRTLSNDALPNNGVRAGWSG